MENRIPESEMTKLLWPALMEAVNWNKKTELMVEQALRHMKSNLMLLSRFTKSNKAQVTLMMTMQEYCFVNQDLLKTYNRFCLLFYKAEVLGEDAILEWYNDDQTTGSGRSAFMAEMKEMVDWLNTAEVEDQ